MQKSKTPDVLIHLAWDDPESVPSFEERSEAIHQQCNREIIYYLVKKKALTTLASENSDYLVQLVQTIISAKSAIQ